MIKKLLFSLGLSSLLVLSMVGLAIAAPGGESSPLPSRELEKVRDATAKYKDVNVALKDGFVSTIECAEEPGKGAMGVHYVHPGRMADPRLDPSQPEILLYIPSDEGFKLVGVEYFYAIDDQVELQAPSLFGRTFDGPMPGHEPGQPAHYDLHVWLWETNPSGLFAPWNPNLSCSLGAG